MRRFLRIALLLVVSLASGCATSSMYSWGSYEQDLYKYYKSPDNLEDLESNLAVLLERAEEKQSVPPGLYAEYGYIMSEMGNSESAVKYFEKEKATWPESSQLMDTMIAAVRR